MSWLVSWWADDCSDRRARLWPDESNKVPAYPWTAPGSPLEYPISYVAGMQKRLPDLFNMDQLRRSVMSALDGKPDIRTEQTMRIDAWTAYTKVRDQNET